MINRRILVLAGVTTPFVRPSLASDAEWPTKPVRLLVGYPAGSAPDVVARAFSNELASELGQPVIVENRVGASGNIAMDRVAKAIDDHTLGLPINGNLTTANQLNPKLSFNTYKDFSFITLVGTTPMVLVAQPSLPIGKAFFDAGVSAGDKWNYGSVGTGSVSHLWMEMMQAATGLKAQHVPFAGAQQIMAAMIGGQIQMGLMPPGSAMAQVRAGRVRAIAVTGARSELVPNVSTISELGLDIYPLEGWAAVVGPASLSSTAVKKLSTIIPKLLAQDDIRQRLFAQGWHSDGSTPEKLAVRIKEESARFTYIIRKLGLQNGI